MRILPLLLFLALPLAAAARFGSEFDLLPRGTRSLSMGGTAAASAADAYGQLVNPAALTALSRPEFAIEYTPLWDLGDDFGTGVLVFPLDTLLTLGAAYSRLEVNDIPWYDPLPGSSAEDRLNDPALRSTGQSRASFGDVYDLMSVGLAREARFKITPQALHRLSVPLSVAAGASLKFFRQRFLFPASLGEHDYEGHALDLDLGLLLTFQLDKDLLSGRPTRFFRTGYSVRNALASEIKYNSTRDYVDPAERVLTLGFAFTEVFPRLRGAATGAIDLVRWNGEQEERYGLEYAWNERFYGRAGILDRGFTLGAGVRYKWFCVDYSFRSHELANTPYQLSFSVSWPRFKP